MVNNKNGRAQPGLNHWLLQFVKDEEIIQNWWNIPISEKLLMKIASTYTKPIIYL